MFAAKEAPEARIALRRLSGGWRLSLEQRAKGGGFCVFCGGKRAYFNACVKDVVFCGHFIQPVSFLFLNLVGDDV